MAVDPAVLASIRALAEREPENDGLKLHLGGLLLDSGAAKEALSIATSLLALRPDSLEALTLAERAADAAGETARAESYRRLRAALSGAPAPLRVQPVERPSEPAPELADDEPVQELGTLRVLRGGAAAAPEPPPLMLADVGGMEEVKRRLNLAFLGPLRNPKVRELYGKSLRGGMLLYGPPGCGKTFIARATAGELGARFVSVGLTDVLEMWFSKSEHNLHEIFEHARRSAPCLLFLDEIDALGRKRELTRRATGVNIVNQLLSELDGLSAKNEGVFVLAATNHPWDVDVALRRPGRFDRTVLVLPPDRPAREAILRFHLRERPMAEGFEAAPFAEKTDGFSGADLARLCEAAAEHAMEASIETGDVRPIGAVDFKAALAETRGSTRAWFEMARSYALYANEGGVYDDLVAYLRTHKIV